MSGLIPRRPPTSRAESRCCELPGLRSQGVKFGIAVPSRVAQANERRTQGRDHPVLLGVPETQYMTCLILRKMA